MRRSRHCAARSTLKPDFADAWRTLGDHLHAIGDATAADAAYARQIRASTRDPRLLEPAVALQEGRIAVAEALLREHLRQHPTDVAALRMLAEVAGRLGRYADAELLLNRCVELAPSFLPARHNLALVLTRQGRAADALAQARQLLDREPRNAGFRNLMAAIQSQLGEYDESIRLYAGVLADYPQQPKVWMSYGHGLKTAGRTDEAIEAYRKATSIAPQLGEAWWSLANLKTFRFAAADLATMQRQLARTDLAHDDRFHLHFALGKALEDAQQFEDSFGHYAEANRLRRESIRYDADETTAAVQRSKAVLSGDFFAARRNAGCPAPDPIFIIGLPRSGSTLLEQILSSHSQVEGTMELPDLPAMVYGLMAGDGGSTPARPDRSRYPGVLAELDHDRLRALGEEYLERTRIQRKTAAPYFIDKLPNNWQHVGLIHLILPRAKIVDARRHPLSCGFSVFKQHFARGQASASASTRSAAITGTMSSCWRISTPCCRDACTGCTTRRWWPIRKRKSAACSTTADCRSRRLACASTRTSARCARRAPSRCGSRSTATRWSNGGTTSAGSGRCRTHWGRYCRRIPPYRAFRWIRMVEQLEPGTQFNYKGHH